MTERMTIGGPDDVMGFQDGEGFLIVVDGIGVTKLPAIVNEKWPTLKVAVLSAVQEWWKAEHANAKTKD